MGELEKKKKIKSAKEALGEEGDLPKKCSMMKDFVSISLLIKPNEFTGCIMNCLLKLKSYSEFYLIYALSYFPLI